MMKMIKLLERHPLEWNLLHLKVATQIENSRGFHSEAKVKETREIQQALDMRLAILRMMIQESQR